MAVLDFHTLRISSITRSTADSVSLTFDIPSDLKQVFSFIPGQYLTLKTQIQGQEVRRSYSICSSAQDSELRVGIKEVKGGLFSTFANRELQEGTSLEVMPPMGNFHTDMAAGHYVAFAGGSGITPILSIISSTLHAVEGARFTLIYGNRDESHIMFHQELKNLQAQYGDRLRVIHRLSAAATGEHEAGRIDGISINQWNGQLYDASEVKSFFLCGPGGLMDTVQTALFNLGVSKEKMVIELFTAPMKEAEAPAVAPVEDDSDFDGNSAVKVIIDDEEFDFNLNASSESILDAGLDAGADLPFACKGGVCCTCRAKVTSGQVTMDQNFSLDDKEIAEGYVLTCQCHPASSKVVLSYDE